MHSVFEQFVGELRGATGKGDSSAAIRSIMTRYISNPEPLISATPESGDDEVMLFQDQHLSVWRCRFQPHVIMPPHEHKLTAHIGVYSGSEKNILFKQEQGVLKHHSTQIVKSGDVFTMDEDGIHAVTGNGDQPSDALHVYMGPLTMLNRDLFDWQTGAPVEFTSENFNEMKKPSSELPAY